MSNEFNDLIDKILSLQEILDKKDVLNELIASELKMRFKNNFGDDRRTDINDTRQDISNEDLIPEETRVLTISRSGYAKTRLLMNIVSSAEVVKVKSCCCCQRRGPNSKLICIE